MMKELMFPVSVLTHVISTFDPSMFKLKVGEIELCCTGVRTTATFDDLLSLPDNKPGDVIVWASMTPAARTEYLSFKENVAAPEKKVRDLNLIDGLNKVGCLLMTYILHGSLNGLSMSPPQVPRFALEASGTKAEEYALGSVSSVSKFCGAKFPQSLQHFASLFYYVPLTMKSRLALSFAGNRIFSIVSMTANAVAARCGTNAVMALMYAETTLNNAPYVSFHPDHPKNPMGNAMKKVLAFIGEACVESGVDLTNLFSRNSALFLPDVQRQMHMKVSDVPGSFPDIDAFRVAVAAEFSIAHMSATRPL